MSRDGLKLQVLKLQLSFQERLKESRLPPASACLELRNYISEHLSFKNELLFYVFAKQENIVHKH